MIYAFNEETQQYIGGFFDVTKKKDTELLHREHSVFNREAIVMKGGKIVRRFMKNTNKHCYPIFPRFNPRTYQRHQIIIQGWDYYMDTSDVELTELEVPILEELSEQSLTYSNVQVFPAKITVRQLIDGGLVGELAHDMSQEVVPQFL